MDIESIKAALMARAQRGGQPMSGGGAAPMSGQPRVTPPSQPPMGGTGSPTPNAAPNPSMSAPPAPRVNIGSRQPAAAGGSGNPAAGMARMAQAAQGPNFDDETKKVAKVLVTKLIGYL